MSYSDIEALRRAHRHAADALMPGVNEACDIAYKAAVEHALRLREAQDAMNAALAHPVMRMESAVVFAELRSGQIKQFIEDAGPEYVEALLTRLDDAAGRIRLAMDNRNSNLLISGA